MRSIILASQSPRRKDLLTLMGLEFTVVPSEFEEHLDSSRTTDEVAIELGLGKARTVAMQYPQAIVIGADTIVTINGQQLGKADDEAHAREMLRAFSGKANTITSSVVVICKELNIKITEAYTSTVMFKTLDEAAIDTYLKLNDWQDKAGTYAVQSGQHIIDHIEGDYTTVLGLPVPPLARILQSLGVDTKPVNLVPPVPQK